MTRDEADTRLLLDIGLALDSCIPARTPRCPTAPDTQASASRYWRARGAQQAVVFVQSDDRFRQLSGAVQDAWVEVVGEENFHRRDLEGTMSFASDGETVSFGSR